MQEYPEIIVGTYEEFLLGFKIEKNDDMKFKLTLDMASHAHQGSIRCVAVYKDILVSSGADEYVNVSNLSTRKEVAVLTPHAGTVTSLLFAPDGSHLISGSQDGSIVIMRCSDWTLMKTWNGAHKKANGVIGMSIHPSGKLLLSIGADHILRVWNLVKGRQAYAVNFSKRISPGNTLNGVAWSFNGDHYGISIGQTVEVYNTNSAAVTYALQSASRVSVFDLTQDSIIAIGRDDGVIEIHDITTKQPILEQKSHENRIKCLQFFKYNEELFLVSADSQGCIKLWRWKRNRKVQKLTMEASADSDCRVLCLSLFSQDEVKTDTDKLDTSINKSTVPNKRKIISKKENESNTSVVDQPNNKLSASKSKRKSSNFEVTITPKKNYLKHNTSSTSLWNVT